MKNKRVQRQIISFESWLIDVIFKLMQIIFFTHIDTMRDQIRKYYLNAHSNDQTLIKTKKNDIEEADFSNK